MHIPERPTHYKQMAEKAAVNIHLRQQATRLLLLYAGQAEGFRPALAFIEANAKIPKNKVSEIRRILIERGLICYDRQSCIIYISWIRIQAFSLLERPLLLSRGKYVFFPFKVDKYIDDYKPDKYKTQHRLVPVPLTLEQCRQLHILEEMSQETFTDIIRCTG